MTIPPRPNRVPGDYSWYAWEKLYKPKFKQPEDRSLLVVTGSRYRFWNTTGKLISCLNDGWCFLRLDTKVPPTIENGEEDDEDYYYDEEGEEENEILVHSCQLIPLEN